MTGTTLTESKVAGLSVYLLALLLDVQPVDVVIILHGFFQKALHLSLDFQLVVERSNNTPPLGVTAVFRLIDVEMLP